MYLQITTRCNMSCLHCCYSCDANGEDMTIETLRNAFNTLGDEIVSLGGGEPTIHPLFWQFLGECLSYSDYVWLATNGSMTNISLCLAKMAKKGIIGCDLSQDEYHSYIEPSVIAAFCKENKNDYSNKNDQRGVRDVTQHIVNQGRAKENEIGDFSDCCCPDIFVKPNGDVYACGCDNTPCFGNVNNEVIVPDNWQFGECYKNQIIEV